jgi:hypothetical protein
VTVNETWAYLALLAIVFAFYLLGRLLGARAGRRRERMRCCRLCHSAFLHTGSGAARWLWNAIDSGADELMDEGEFFGPRRSDEPPLH